MPMLPRPYWLHQSKIKMTTETIALLVYLALLVGVVVFYKHKSSGYQPQGKKPVNPPKFK